MQDTHNSITLTAEQANTLNTTGHLEGFKELCEWQPSFLGRVVKRDDGWWFFSDDDSIGKRVTPTRAVGQVYACKEPCAWGEDKYGTERVFFEADQSEPRPDVAWDYYDEPDAIRLHAKIATEPTLSIHEGKLVWTYDLVKE